MEQRIHRAADHKLPASDFPNRLRGVGEERWGARGGRPLEPVRPGIRGPPPPPRHSHVWRRTVHGLTYNVQKLLMEMDSELYDEEAEKYEGRMKSQAGAAA